MATKPSCGALGSSRWLRTSAGSALQASARKCRRPPSSMASRALIAMFSSADSSCPGSASTGGQVADASTSMRMRWSMVRRSMSATEWTSWPTSTALGCSTWRRENASSLPVSSAPRREARAAAATSWRPCASSVTVGSSSSTCRLPWITVSRLLKSCAMPPVSWPTLSRRWACSSAFSDCARCRQVASRLQTDSRKRSASSPRCCAVRACTTSAPMVRPRSDSGTASAASRPAARWAAEISWRVSGWRASARIG